MPEYWECHVPNVLWRRIRWKGNEKKIRPTGNLSLSSVIRQRLQAESGSESESGFT